MGLVLGQGMLLAAAGIVVDLVGAFWLSQFLKTLLFEVGARDPLTFVAVPSVLLAVAVIAGYVPARRATAVDPVVALRSEWIRPSRRRSDLCRVGPVR